MIVEYLKYGMNIFEKTNKFNKINILFLHGLGSSGKTFIDIMLNEKMKNFNCYSIDLIAYGKSIRPEIPMSFEDYAEHLADFIKMMKKKFYLVVHSMSGVIGLLLAERYPELFYGLINEEGNISIKDCNYSGKIAEMNKDDFINRYFPIMVKNSLENDPNTNIQFCDSKNLHYNSVKLLEFSKNGKIAERLKKLKIPNVYIVGSPNGIGEYSQRLLLKNEIDTIIVKDCGHNIHKDKEEEFIKIIMDFIKKYK